MALATSTSFGPIKSHESSGTITLNDNLFSSHLDAQDYIRQLPSLKNQLRAEIAACDQAQENVNYLATQADLDSQCMVNHTSRAKTLTELH